MDKHTEKCIRYFEAMANYYHKKVEALEGLYREAGPGSDYFHDLRMAEAQEDAFRTCAMALRDEDYWD